MLKSFINKALKAALSELFTNSLDGVSISMGSDLFTESNLNLKNLNIRPDIFDVVLQPLRLVSGHISSLKLEGIAEMAFGGKLRLIIENIYLLFQVDEDIDAERAQILKKLLLEMTAGNNNLPQLLLREVLKKVQGYPSSGGSKDGVGGDAKKKRRLIIKMINYIFTNIVVFLKVIHVRFEVPNADKTCAGFGWTLPIAKIIPYTQSSSNLNKTGSSSMIGVDSGGSTPKLTLYLKGLQMYCDYNCTSYTTPTVVVQKGMSFADIVANEFKSRWATESHTAMLLPIDLEISVAIEVRKKTGLLSLKIATDVSSLRIAFDPKQLEILKEFFDRFVAAHKRLSNQLRVRGIFGRKWLPPIVSEVGGITVLPHLLVSGQFYPQLGTIPRRKANDSIVSLLKSRLGPNWGKALWRHAYKLVLDDLRKKRPLGRWVEIIKLIWARKQYSFIYSRLLKRSKETGNFVVNVNAKVDVSVALKLFDIEMTFPAQAIYLFRSLSVMICFVELLNSKRKQGFKNASSNGTPLTYERTNLPWRTILRIHSEIIENQRVTAFHRTERLSPDDDTMTEMGDYDDATSVLASDDGSVNSSSTRSLGISATKTVPRSPGTDKRSFFTRQPSAGTTAPSTTSTTSSLSSTAKSVFGTARVATTVQHAAMKMINSTFSTAPAPGDDLDSKLLGRSDLAAFTEWFAMFEHEDKGSVFDVSNMITTTSAGTPVAPASTTTTTKPQGKPPSGPTQSAQTSTAAPSLQPVPLTVPEVINLKDIHYEVFDWQLGGTAPSEELIIDGVQAIFAKDQPPITIVPPDIAFHFHHLEWSLRYPLEENTRKIMASIVVKDVAANVIITHGNAAQTPSNSSTNIVGTQTPISHSLLSRNQRLDDYQLRNLQGFVSLMGSLIQLRLTISSVEVSLHVHNEDLSKILNGESIHFPSSKERKGTITSYYQEDINTATRGRGELEDEIDDRSDRKQDDQYDSDDQADESSEGSDQDKLSDLPDRSSQNIMPLNQSNVGKQANDRSAWDELLLKYKPPASTQSAIVSGPSTAAAPVVAMEDAEEVVTVLTSKGNDRFLILCVLLDFDYKGEGAADVQFQLGELSLDFSGGGLATLIDHPSLDNLNRIFSTWKAIQSLLLERKNPFHLRHTAYDDILFHQSNASGTVLTTIDTVPSMPATPSMPKSSREAESVSRTGGAVLANPVPREHVLGLLNVEHWRSILDYILPKIVTVSVRSSRIQADLMTASVLRNVILSTFQEVSNRASVNRQHRSTLNEQYSMSFLSELPPYLAMLQEFRKRATRTSADIAFRKDRSKMVFSGMEMSVCKSASAGVAPQLELKCLGMELTIPIDDDTLIVALALLLGSYFPVYH